MKKKACIVLLMVVCCVFAPLNALASNKANSVNINNSASEEIVSDNENISYDKSIAEAIHNAKIAEKESEKGSASAQVSRVVSPPSDDSNRFTLGWFIALLVLVGAGLGIYFYNRRKK